MTKSMEQGPPVEADGRFGGQEIPHLLQYPKIPSRMQTSLSLDPVNIQQKQTTAWPCFFNPLKPKLV
jgi:hypothetical protein